MDDPKENFDKKNFDKKNVWKKRWKKIYTQGMYLF